MELIIKPTERCNFSCTFCSSPKLAQSQTAQIKLEQIFQFLDRFPNTNTIIINGGDPLMMPPQYYFKILDYIEQRGMETTLAFTTNLWAFYKNPKIWKDLFRHRLVGVTTSFNYGETRRVTPEQNYTEELFWKVSDLFLSEIGYRPDFISVINEENYDTALDNVYLAKKMDVECKLNYAMASGHQSKPFLKGKIYRTYLDIIKLGLSQWEYNAKQLLRKSHVLKTTCPLNRECDSNIRCLQPDGDYYSCGAFGDDKEFPINFEMEMYSDQIQRPLSNQFELHSMKADCLTCPLFSICNGCRKTIRDVKRHGMVEEHCSEMQKNLTDILELFHGTHQSVN